MRRQFGKTIVELAELDPKIILITGDVEHNMYEFKKKFPKRFYNIGLCEQSMISVAAGMALEGLKPWVYSITPFVIERPFEQVKIDIDQQNVNLKLIGYSNYPSAGPTHKDLDAKGLSLLFKNIQSYFPSSPEEARDMMLKAYDSISPAFISLNK